MKYNRFEELPIWKDAIKLAVKVFALTARRNPGATGVFEIKLSGQRYPYRIILLKDLNGHDARAVDVHIHFARVCR